MKRWKLGTFGKGNLVAWQTINHVKQGKVWYRHHFKYEDMQMLKFLIEEAVYGPEVIRKGMIRKTQKKLGNAVWKKLGER